MAQTIVIANATYADVPALEVNKSGGGMATYLDTSDGDVLAEDVLAGKICYSSGARVVGTGTGGGGSKYGISIDDMFETDENEVLSKPTGDINLTISEFKDIAGYGLYYQFSRNNAIKSIVFADLEQVTTTNAMQHMCNTCTGLRTVSFPKLHTVSGSTGIGYSFYSCSGLTSASFSALTTVSGTTGCSYMFYGCTNLESVDFSNLKTVGNPSLGNTANNRHFYNAFYNCNKLLEITFPSLEAIYCNGNNTTYGSFSNNNKVKKFYFPKLTTMTWSSAYTNANKAQPIEGMFYGCTALTEIHFALTNKTAVEAMTGYSVKWGAPSSCQILFDL